MPLTSLLVKTVIAQLPTGKAIAYFTICFTIIVGILVAFPYVAFETDFLRTRRAGWSFLLAIGWLGSVALLVPLAVLLRQLVFGRSCAVWSDGENIIYWDKRLLNVRKDQVESVSLGTSGRFNSPTIVLHTRDGNDQRIPTTLLSENPDVVVSRLREEIGIYVRSQ